MKERLFYIFILSLLPCMVFADLGSTDIQAVCQLTFRDGTVMNGFILIGDGSLHSYMDPRGFIYDDMQPIIFDFNFRAIDFEKGIVVLDTDTLTGYPFDDREKLYFFIEETSDKFTYKDIHIMKEISGGFEELHIENHRAFVLSKYIPVYPEVPDYLYLKENVFEEQPFFKSQGMKETKMIKVDISNLSRIELITKPHESVLKQIENKENRFKEYLKNCEDCEFLFPEWLHDYIDKYGSKNRGIHNPYRKWIMK